MNIPLDGSWTIERAEELRQKLLAAVAEGGELTLDAGGVEEADYTFFQLLHAAAASMRKRGGSLRITLPDRLEQRAAQCGFSLLSSGFGH